MEIIFLRNYSTKNSEFANQSDFRKVKDDFENLHLYQKKWALKQISSLDRKFIVSLYNENVYSNAFHLNRTKQDIEKVENILDKARVKSCKGYKRNDRFSSLHRFENTIKKMFIAFFEIFGYLSAEKTMKHISKIDQKYNHQNDGSHVKKSKPLTKKGFKDAIIHYHERVKTGDPTPLAEILKQKGYSTVIDSMEFDEESSFNDLDLSGLIFKNCKFQRCNFSNSILNDTKFVLCPSIYHTNFNNAKLQNCQFNTCTIKNVMFLCARISDSLFDNNDILGCSFESAKMFNNNFTKCTMSSTHFLMLIGKDNEIKNSNLQNSIFFERESCFKLDASSYSTLEVTKPLTAVLYHPINRGITTPKTIIKVGEVSQSIPLRISTETFGIDQERINEEISEELKQIKIEKNNEKEFVSYSYELLDSIDKDNSDKFISAKKIRNKGKLIGRYIDSIVLTGGEDVPPALYGQDREEETQWGDDYQRSVLELSLIKESQQKGIPLMAICRGFQMVNIYNGAQLTQDLSGHKGVQYYNKIDADHKGLYGGDVDEFYGAVFHHQGIKDSQQATHNLEPVIRHNGIIKAVESKHPAGAPIIGLQFHPEFLGTATATNWVGELIDKHAGKIISKINDNFWIILRDSAKTYRKKRLNLQAVKCFDRTKFGQ